MLQVGMQVIVNCELDLLEVDENIKVVVTQDLLDNNGRMGVVVEADNGLYKLDLNDDIWYVEEWLIPQDTDAKVVCDDCGREFSYADVKYIGNGKYMCKECYDKQPHCSKCGKIVTGETNIDGEYLCGSCIRELANRNSYDYVPRYAPRSNDNDNSLLIGAEIEIDNGDCNDKTMKEISAIMGKSVYYMGDGSLRTGFEIATHPFSFDFWHDKVDYIDKMFSVAKRNGYRAHDTNTCGLHLHVNRAQLPTDNLSEDEVINNILLIMETFYEELINFARRHSTNYAPFLQDRARTDNVTLKYVKRLKGTFCGEKYQALNLCHGKTIEFRLFKGTLKIETFMATVELVNNIVQIARDGNIDGLTWNDIINYNSDVNKYIIDYNTERGITSDKVVYSMSYIEMHKDEFGIDNFINGDFGIDLSSCAGKYIYYLLGVLHANGVTTRDGGKVRYDNIDGRKIKVNNSHLITGARTNVYSSDDIMDLWFE